MVLVVVLIRECAMTYADLGVNTIFFKKRVLCLPAPPPDPLDATMTNAHLALMIGVLVSVQLFSSSQAQYQMGVMFCLVGIRKNSEIIRGVFKIRRGYSFKKIARFCPSWYFFNNFIRFFKTKIDFYSFAFLPPKICLFEAEAGRGLL